MTYKTDDINLVYKIIEWCKDKYSREECDSEVLKLYELACKASLYLSGRALDEQEYYDKYGNEILRLAKEYGIYTYWEEQIDSMKVRQGKWDNSRPWEEAKKDIKISVSDIIELNKKMERHLKELDRQRAIGEEAMRGVIIGGRDDD